ncbi:MAG: ATP synthase F1 subunit delta [Clostridia bacterium]|nr:ATP synthase F1 subunit delta [Clostridia bacterium]
MATIVNERYAISLYEVAQEEGSITEMLDELTAIAQIVRETPAFLKMLQTPSIALEDKKKVLVQTFNGKINPYLLNFLMLITEKGRVGGLLEMQEAYKQRYYDEQGICEVHATTAVPMDETLTEKLRVKLEKITGKTVILLTKVDASILGGVVLKLGNEQIDTSVKAKLTELASKMTQIIA